ncbi:endonuclease MutS2 [Sphingobacterium bovistauri]|uniref:Endonuclease MutS2 n=1 Tax=Sphingobacterium bovistauri TaxID=2781959 RepID=A0ABS7Z436_9SPHI|nr:endonuclease MutS2 [Sphingobacterium bovistauri]MCA5004936.1 endonuclease MutS2 [Sphingobacterium bovistauri]
MIYPQNAIDKLGFTEIRDLIKEKCLSEAGRLMVEKIQPQIKVDQIDRFLRQTHEFKQLLQHDEPLPVDHIYPIKPLADKAKLEGSFLSEDELYRMLLALRTVFNIIRYFNDREGQYAHLELLFEHLPIEKSIIRSIEKVLDDRGKLKNNASRLLEAITNEIIKSEQEARKRLDSVFKQAQANGWTADGGLTIRDGRFCIPILAENKRKLKGLIHDESATGQTAYVEPEEVFHLNNKVRDLEFDRRREVVRILTELTSEIRPHVPLLLSYHGLITKLDFVRAKALFAIDLQANMPILDKEASVNLVQARHPILYLNSLRDKNEIVPLNIKIDATDRIILVSGPNAGGKSVCMKTVGLLQLMVQSGVLIPADESSSVGIFKQIFADIGDDQSIESDLSTYSAHLSKMKHFTTFANARTLVIIDEFGTGTDPQFGGPIAEAVLEQLNTKQVRGVITTHYSNLKLFANHTAGVENASMLFDNQKMQPLYILQIGKPGSSYAFEIAQKIGLSKDILEYAKLKIGVQQKKVDTMLVDLERDKKEIVDTKYVIGKRERELVELKSKYEKLNSDLENNKREIIRNAKEEAKLILKDANKLIENTISEIKTVKADKDKTKEIRSKLNQSLDKHSKSLEKDAKNNKPVVSNVTPELEVGDWVRIEDSGSEGEILEITKSNTLIVALGELRTVLKRNRVTKLRSKEKSAAKKRISSIATESAADFYPELDVRGMRTEDALQKIELVLDRAVMIGYPSLKIIHGKGDGILRKFIRDYLRKYNHVSRFEDEHADRGGDGITYAYIG